MPSTNFSQRLQQILDIENLTIYGASQIIGAKTDEPLKTVHRRLSSWMQSSPKTIADLEAMLSVLGYELIIRKSKKGR